MKTILIADIHNRHSLVDKILKAEAPDKAIFLGDHFDEFGDSPAEAVAAAQWIKARMANYPNDVFCWGNHDMSYGFTSRYTKCSGYTQTKAAVIDTVLTYDQWDRFVFYHWLADGWLCSHAGLHPSHIKGKRNIRKFLNSTAHEANKMLRQSDKHWMYAAGVARWGYAPIGGITWLDFDDEFEPIEGLNQIIGHTNMLRRGRDGKPGYKEGKDSKNWDLDTNNLYYGVWDDKELTIKYSPDEIPNWITP